MIPPIACVDPIDSVCWLLLLTFDKVVDLSIYFIRILFFCSIQFMKLFLKQM